MFYNLLSAADDSPCMFLVIKLYHEWWFLCFTDKRLHLEAVPWPCNYATPNIYQPTGYLLLDHVFFFEII